MIDKIFLRQWQLGFNFCHSDCREIEGQSKVLMGRPSLDWLLLAFGAKGEWENGIRRVYYISGKRYVSYIS